MEKKNKLGKGKGISQDTQSGASDEGRANSHNSKAMEGRQTENLSQNDNKQSQSEKGQGNFPESQPQGKKKKHRGSKRRNAQKDSDEPPEEPQTSSSQSGSQPQTHQQPAGQGQRSSRAEERQTQVVQQPQHSIDLDQGQRLQPEQQMWGQGKRVGSAPQPTQQAWGQDQQQVSGSAPQPTQQSWGRGRGQQQGSGSAPQPTQQAWSRGRGPQQGSGSAPQPTQQAWGQVQQQGSGSAPKPTQQSWCQVQQQASGSAPQPTQQSWGQVQQQASGSALQPTQQSWGRGQQQGSGSALQPTQPPWGWGQQQVSGSAPQLTQQAWGRGRSQPQVSGSAPQPTQQVWGRGQPQVSGSAPQSTQQAWSRGQPQGSGSAPQPTQQAWGQGQWPQPAQKPWGQGQRPQPAQQVFGLDHGNSAQKKQVHSFQGSKSAGKLMEEHSKGTTCSEFAPRIPAPIKSGRTIYVKTNHFRITIPDQNINVYHYDVVFEPDKPKYLLRPVWNKFVSDQFPKRIAVFDGCKNAYTRKPLIESGSLYSADVSILNPESNKEKDFKITIKEVRVVDLSILCNFREKMAKDKRKKVLPEAEISVLETIMKNFPSDALVYSGRLFFPKMESDPHIMPLSPRLTMRNGFYQSVFMGYKLYLNFDIAHRAFYRESYMLDIIENFKLRGVQTSDLTSLRPSDLHIPELNRFIRDMKVEYEMPNNSSSRRVYKVNKAVESALNQKFTDENNRSLTVNDYFAERGYRLKYPNLPLLWVGPTKKTIYIPLEFCKVVKDQLYRGDVNSFETREMAKNATHNAENRSRFTLDELAKASVNNAYTTEFGISVSGEMECVPARVLEPPKLLTETTINVNKGVWTIRNFLEPKSLNRWCILNLDKGAPKQCIIHLQNMIRDKGRFFKMKIGDPVRNPMDVEPNFADLRKVFSQLNKMDIVFVIIPELKGVYSRVKTICETQEGILTQCIKSKTINQPPNKVITTIDNILLKVNAKLGGKNHTLHNTSVPACLKGGPVMIVGADVTHSASSSKIPSIAAVAVSSDRNAFQYGTTTRVQIGEIIKDLEEIIRIHLQKFKTNRKMYPEKIIFFRDGVSEGEMEKVFNQELSAIKRACKGLCNPKITLLVVQKRHHTRFYPTNLNDTQGKNYNVPVGTCVDSDVVHPRDLDFYLVSHMSILGTARPTRYRLLYDDNKLTDDELERLSYYLCHMFSRCNRSVSYPSPTYNAHLAAYRSRAYLEGLNLTAFDDLSKIQEKMKDNISNISPMFFV